MPASPKHSQAYSAEDGGGISTISKVRYVSSAAAIALLIFAEFIILNAIWKIDMLPLLYFAVVAIVMLLVLLAICFLLFFKMKRASGTATAVRVIIALIVVIGMQFLSVFISSATGKLTETLTSITEPKTKTSTFAVFVLTEDSAQDLVDASAYKFAISNTDAAEVTQQYLSKLEDEIGQAVTTNVYATIPEIVEALYDGSCGAMVLNSAYEEILADSEDYADFADKTRVLYEISITEEVEADSDSDSNTEENDTAAKMPDTISDITNTPFVMYLSGSDTRDDTLSTSTRSDVNIMAVVNPVTKQVLLINTPRDYYVANPAGNGAQDKLTHCSLDGVDNSVKALANLYGIEIQYYAQVNFSGFETLIDAIGGIDVESDVAFIAQEGNYQIIQGTNHLNGNQALGFARERHALAGGDIDRGNNQMKVISAVINQMSASTLLLNYSDILDSMQGMFVTNMSTDNISALVKMQISDMASWNINSIAVSGTGGYDITYWIPGMSVYVMYPDEASVSYASQLIERVLNGDELTDGDLEMP